MNYKVTQVIDGTKYETLRDILPEKGELKILFVGKTPSVKSVMIGHYFLGVRGKNFWKKLNEYGLLKFLQGEYGDDWLVKNDYGITHVSKITHESQNPT